MTELSNTKAFINIQHKLADSIRDPKLASDFDTRRLRVYQELFFNNIEGFCTGTFPVLKSVLANEEWHRLIRAFFIEHNCETPHFIEISEEFLAFLNEQQEGLPYPWALELAHYEWVELASSVAPGEQTVPATTNWQTADLSLSPSAWPLAYQYPVYTITASNAQDIVETPTHIIVYRTNTGEVKFLTTDPLSVFVLAQLQQNPEQNFDALSQLLQSDQVKITESQANTYLNQAIPSYLVRGILIAKK